MELKVILSKTAVTYITHRRVVGDVGQGKVHDQLASFAEGHNLGHSSAEFDGVRMLLEPRLLDILVDDLAEQWHDDAFQLIECLCK